MNEFVLSIGGIILTGDKQSTRRNKTCPTAWFYATYPT